MKKRNVHTRNTQQGGYTLFIALIIASIVMALSVSVASFVRQQLILSGYNERSELAFYAADAGFECARYHDIAGAFDVGESQTINCLGDSITTGGTVSGETQSYAIDWQVDNRDVCSVISVTKTSADGAVSTEIEADGYNAACDDVTDDQEVLERSILYTY